MVRIEMGERWFVRRKQAELLAAIGTGTVPLMQLDHLKQ